MAEWPYGTTQWKRLRLDHLTLEPLCQGCLPRIVPANTVDHVKPISQGGDPFPDHDGLKSYCRSCHAEKTARGPEAGAIRTNAPLKGGDVKGYPRDPNHPWNKARQAGG